MNRSLLLNDYEKAVENLAEALASDHDTDLEKAGCIKYFELCFEIAWKSVKAVSEEMGLESSSPKSSLKNAFANKWIDNEEIWLAMLNARNLMSHTYNAATALKIYTQLKEYLHALKKLLDTLKTLS